MKIFRQRETPEVFWQTLADAGLVQGAMPSGTASANNEGSPWFVKVMLGAVAWLSACFFLGFIGAFMGRLLESEWVRAILGVIACVVAASYFFKAKSSAFVDQLLFILALVGQGLVLSAIWAWLGEHEPSPTFWWWTALFGVVVLVAIPYLPNRFLSAALVLFSLYFAGFQSFIMLFIVLCLAALAMVLHYQWKKPRLWPAVALALALVPFFVVEARDTFFFVSMRTARVGHLGSWYFYLVRFGLIVVWLGIVFSLLKRVTAKPFAFENVGVWLLALLLAAGTWTVPMALFALTVFFLGFSQRDKLLEGIGVAQLLWAVGYYYYALQNTLLLKSLTLAALGAALLLLYAVSRYLLPRFCEGEKA